MVGYVTPRQIEYLKRLRKKLGVSQEQVANAMHICRVSYGDKESGKSRMTTDSYELGKAYLQAVSAERRLRRQTRE